ncbi:MAG TPA: transposase [Candidatus Dormibacteraeota bacterium]|nr:transposase [Candidatus Dormibacteraeota bacterium]
MPGRLALADRGFTTHPLFAAMAATGAHLCWRATGNAVLPVLERHPDGSYRSEMVASTDKRRQSVVPVRVIEYAIEDPGRPPIEDLTYRLVTTLLDPARAPARDPAALYSERWESALDELKTHQNGLEWWCAPRPPMGSTRRPGVGSA